MKNTTQTNRFLKRLGMLTFSFFIISLIFLNTHKVFAIYEDIELVTKASKVPISLTFKKDGGGMFTLFECPGEVFAKNEISNSSCEIRNQTTIDTTIKVVERFDDYYKVIAIENAKYEEGNNSTGPIIVPMNRPIFMEGWINKDLLPDNVLQNALTLLENKSVPSSKQEVKSDSTTNSIPVAVLERDQPTTASLNNINNNSEEDLSNHFNYLSLILIIPAGLYLFIKIAQIIIVSVENFNKELLKIEEEERLKKEEEEKLHEAERIRKIQEYEFEENKRYIDKTYLKHLESSKKFLEIVKNLYNENNNYITWKERDQILEEFSDDKSFFSEKVTYYKNEPIVNKFLDKYKNFKEYIKDYNEKFVLKRRNELKNFFTNIEGKSLDNQQQVAVITDEYSNLIIAGAGSGKTLTIIGKIKYLIEKCNIEPDKILLLSYTKKTVEELNDRLVKLGIVGFATTFHKLGYDYVREYSDKAPTLANENYLTEVIADFLKNKIFLYEQALKSFVQFSACYMEIPEEDDKFESLGEKLDIKKGVDYQTLRSKYNGEITNKRLETKRELNTFSGERVKSIEELIIANYLFVNGINYQYEKTYPYKIIDKLGKNIAVAPDFYLPDYDIWLEHFGISKDGRARWHTTEYHEKRYLETMELKRSMHKKMGTKLIETYSWYNKESILLERLRESLESEGVVLKPMDEKDLYKKIIEHDTKFGNQLIKLIESFINLSKSRRMESGYLRQLFENENKGNKFMYIRQNLFLDFMLPILDFYNQRLKEKDEIDFNDMINLATDLISKKGIRTNFKYIVVDEYQDISFARFDFIKKIRELSNARLVCVGDDWQSIYRFAGSDVSLFSDFGKFVGEYEKLLIEKTYRNSQQLINISANFIQKNPEQIKKNPVSNLSLPDPIKFVWYKNDNLYLKLEEQIVDIITEYGANKNILILGRHSFDLDDVLYIRNGKEKKLRDEVLKYNYETGELKISRFSNINLRFTTVHKSKGLEADNVIILNLKNDLYGFPNKLTDDPIISVLLGQSLEEFRFSEERRMFYVALTRTKNRVYLLIPENEDSLFVDEILKDSGSFNYLTENNNGKTQLKNCLFCKTGKLIIRTNSSTGEEFLGCTHYPTCNQSYRDINILNNTTVCPSCMSGYLTVKSSVHGKFLGCTNYPGCNQIINL